MSEPLNQGASLPPRGQQRWWKIISPTRGNPLVAVILGDTFVGQWTHYVPPTLPCAMTAECHWCKAGLAPRYYGYTPALVGTRGELRVLSLTYHACCQLTDTLKRRGTLRGMEVRLHRKYGSERAPVVVHTLREIPGDKLPPAFDVVDSLARMWGINRDYLARGCRRLGADETAEKYMRERITHQMAVGGDSIPSGDDAA